MKLYILITILLFPLISSYSQETQEKEKWTCYTDDKVLLMDDYRTKGIFEYVDGNLWIVTDRGINIFDGKQWKKIDQKTELTKKRIGSYLVDSKNNIWIGTGSPEIYFPGLATSSLYGGGVVIYNGKEWTAIKTKDIGIKAAIITRMFETSSGDIWLAVSSVDADFEKLVLFPKGALLRFSNNEWTVYKGKDISCYECTQVKGFYEDTNGRPYFWSDHGIYYFENDNFHVIGKKQGYNIWDRRITAAFEDSKKNLWLAAPARVAMYDGKLWRTFDRKNGLPERSWWPLGFNETKDNKIILSMTNGIYTYDGNDQWERDAKQFLSSQAYIDKENRIWAPTHKALEIKEGSEWSKHKDAPKVWGIIEDKNGGVWTLSKKKGVNRYKDGEWQLFSEKNELPSNKILMGHLTKDGTVWIGTTKGICKCEYD